MDIIFLSAVNGYWPTMCTAPSAHGTSHHVISRSNRQHHKTTTPNLVNTQPASVHEAGFIKWVRRNKRCDTMQYHSTPMQSTAIQSIQINPIQSNPLHSNPIQSNQLSPVNPEFLTKFTHASTSTSNNALTHPPSQRPPSREPIASQALVWPRSYP